MGAYVLNLAAAADYVDSGTNSQSDIGLAATLVLKTSVSGQLLQNATGFSEYYLCCIGGATQGAARLTVIIDGNNGDVRMKLGIGDFENTGHATTMASGISVNTSLYYDIYADYGSSAGFIGIAQGGTELGSATFGAATMGANASNGRVRVGARLHTTSGGVVGRVDGLAIYSAKFTTTADRYRDADDDATTNRLAYWPFPESTLPNAGANEVGAGVALGTATAGATFVAGGTWDGGGGGGTPAGHPAIRRLGLVRAASMLEIGRYSGAGTIMRKAA